MSDLNELAIQNHIEKEFPVLHVPAPNSHNVLPALPNFLATLPPFADMPAPEASCERVDIRRLKKLEIRQGCFEWSKKVPFFYFWVVQNSRSI